MGSGTISLESNILDGVLFGLMELYQHYIIGGAITAMAVGLAIGWMARSASYGRWKVKKGD